MKYVGFPHVWLCWHGNKNSIVMCVLNFSPLSLELHSEGSMTPSPPPTDYIRGGLVDGGVCGGRGRHVHANSAHQHLCEREPSLQRPLCDPQFLSGITVKLFSCLLVPLPLTGNYTPVRKKTCCKLCYWISAGAICIPNHHPRINKWICYFEFMFHSSHRPLVDIIQLRSETRVEQMKKSTGTAWHWHKQPQEKTSSGKTAKVFSMLLPSSGS